MCGRTSRERMRHFRLHRAKGEQTFNGSEQVADRARRRQRLRGAVNVKGENITIV